MVFIDSKGNICQERPKAQAPPQTGQPRSRINTVHAASAPPSRGGGGGGGGGGGSGSGNPLVALGDALGIGDKFVDVPAIPQLQCPATRQPLVYAGALAVATLFVGWRMVVAAGIFYVLTVRAP